jgi:hypothetical protein
LRFSEAFSGISAQCSSFWTALQCIEPTKSKRARPLWTFS